MPPGDPHSAPPAILVEVAIETPGEARDAELAGAGRLELCANLGAGGTTPSAGMIDTVLERARVPVFVIIRPRGGGFCYDRNELASMRRDIAAARAAGAGGIVSGVLTEDGRIDREALPPLLDASGSLPFTFHRAFDFTRGLEEALDLLISLGVERVLTSGGAATALSGAARVASLVARAGDSLTIMAGGGVRADHVARLVAETGVREVHARPTRLESPLHGIAGSGSMAAIVAPRAELDVAGVAALVSAAGVGRSR
jgi:copper homeostasis protein